MPWGMPMEDSRESGGLSYSPFMQKLSDYERWKQHDKFGSWYKQLLPNESGVGLHIGHLLDPECCTGYYSDAARRVSRLSNGNPWLIPSEVTWASIMGEDGYVLEPFKQWFSVDYPCVAITSVNTSYSDFRWWVDNLNTEYSCERWDYEPNDNPITSSVFPFEFLGLVPIWTVLPLNQEYFEEVAQSTINIKKFERLDLLNECWCTIDYIECDDTCASMIDRKNRCNCNAQQRIQEELESVWSGSIDLTKHMTDTCKKVFTEAVSNFYAGWQVVHDAKEKEEQWAYYWWQQQSPFWDSPGQSARMTSEWTDLTNSETRQVS